MKTTKPGQAPPAAAAATSNSTPINNGQGKKAKKRSRVVTSPSGLTPKDKSALLDKDRDGEEALDDDVNEALLDETDSDSSSNGEDDIENERKRMEKLETEKRKDGDPTVPKDVENNDEEEPGDGGRQGPPVGDLAQVFLGAYAAAARPGPTLIPMETNDRIEMKILKGPSGNDISHEEFTKIRDYLIDALITEIIQGNIEDL